MASAEGFGITPSFVPGVNASFPPRGSSLPWVPGLPLKVRFFLPYSRVAPSIIPTLRPLQPPVDAEGPPARHAWSTLYVALELCSVPGEDRIGCPHLPTLQTRTWQPYKCSSSSHTNFSHTELFKKIFFYQFFSLFQDPVITPKWLISIRQQWGLSHF